MHLSTTSLLAILAYTYMTTIFIPFVFASPAKLSSAPCPPDATDEPGGFSAKSNNDPDLGEPVEQYEPAPQYIPVWAPSGSGDDPQHTVEDANPFAGQSAPGEIVVPGSGPEPVPVAGIPVSFPPVWMLAPAPFPPPASTILAPTLQLPLPPAPTTSLVIVPVPLQAPNPDPRPNPVPVAPDVIPTPFSAPAQQQPQLQPHPPIIIPIVATPNATNPEACQVLNCLSVAGAAPCFLTAMGRGESSVRAVTRCVNGGSASICGCISCVGVLGDFFNKKKFCPGGNGETETETGSQTGYPVESVNSQPYVPVPVPLPGPSAAEPLSIPLILYATPPAPVLAPEQNAVGAGTGSNMEGGAAPILIAPKPIYGTPPVPVLAPGQSAIGGGSSPSSASSAESSGEDDGKVGALSFGNGEDDPVAGTNGNGNGTEEDEGCGHECDCECYDDDDDINDANNDHER